MSTVQNIIDRAYRLLGQLNLGESADTNESANLLTALNAMLDSWRNERLMCYAVQDQTIPLVSTNATRTVGPSGDLITTRPITIEGAYIVYSNVSVPVRVIEYDEWAAIPAKTTTSTYPGFLYYQPTMPDGTINLWPIPSGSSTLHILTWTPVLSFASVGLTVTLPPGWEDALAANLAIYIAPEIPVDPRPTVIGMARNTKSMIKKANVRVIKATSELATLLNRSHSNIERGW